MRRAIVKALLAVTALGATTAAAPALASPNQTVYFEATNVLKNPALRPAALAQLDSLGVRATRIVLYWHDVAPGPNSKRRPSFDATNPAFYNWGQYDAVVQAAAARHWQILLTVSGPVPRWATPGGRDTLTRPDPREFGRFFEAVVRHYAGEVSLYSIWNEPNHPQFLLPQYGSRHQPLSPLIYRGLYEAAIAGLQASGKAAGVRLLFGETAPRGTGHDVAPLTFLRGALCLDSHYRRASSCSPLPIAGYAHHAYTTNVGPRFRPSEPNDVTIGVLSRLTRALDLAARAGAIPRNTPIYLTEFGIQSKPNPFLGVPVAQQAEYLAISEQIAYDTRRVAAFSQYLLRDDPQISRPGSTALGTGSIGFQSGLEYSNGRPKPSFAGFRLPLTVSRHGSSVSLWGLVRLATGVTQVEIQVADGRGHFRRLGTATTNKTGYWRLHSSFVNGRRWRVQWVSPSKTTFDGPAIRAY
jgi:hypothetical protein